ncbi:hypothetical protein MTO96_036682 [Rhipicephalus appendiculatus]
MPTDSVQSTGRAAFRIFAGRVRKENPWMAERAGDLRNGRPVHLVDDSSNLQRQRMCSAPAVNCGNVSVLLLGRVFALYQRLEHR